MSPLAFVGLNAILFAAAASDLRSMRIPNHLPLLVTLAALIVALPHTPTEALLRLLSMLVVFTVCLTLYARHVMAGGDLKLLSALALWIPIPELPEFAVMLALAGGAQGLVVLGWQWVVRSPAASAVIRPRMPYALAIALAGLAWSARRIAAA